MGKKYVMTGSFLDGFKASFTKKECILAEKHYPLGYFAVEFLEVDRTLLRELERLVPIFQEELTVFLSARDPSSAALAQQALNAVWDVLIQLPVYQHLEQHSGGVRGLLREMKELPDIVDAMLTHGTDRSEVLHEWLRRLMTLPESIWDFILSTEKMLIRYYGDLPARKPENYALAFGKYKHEVLLNYQMGMEEREDDTSLPEPELPQFLFPLQVSFKAVTDASGKWGFAEQIEFEELSSFLHYDLCHGMSAGNIPRRCECCGHYFLAIGAYDTRYCMRIAPGETVKTCRQVGAHRKEKQRNGTEFVRKEYQKVYNRLRGRKNRGIISADEWNRQVAEAQELKAQAIAGNIDDAELKRRFEKM